MLVGNTVFDNFVATMKSLVKECDGREQEIIDRGRKELAKLVSDDTWLPKQYAEPDPKTFKQYMLFKDDDFTVLCVVWGPGQSAGPHDHTVWGIIGQLRGAEMTRDYFDPEPGRPLQIRSESTLLPGQTAAVSPSIGDIHDVTNVADGISISIHAYGGDLSSLAPRRRRFDAATGDLMPFKSSYH